MALVFSAAGTLYIVLDEENIERIQQFDPFELPPAWTRQLQPLKIPLDIVVCYAKKEEQAFIQSLTVPELVKYLRRGYQERASDHERGVRLEQQVSKKKPD